MGTIGAPDDAVGTSDSHDTTTGHSGDITETDVLIIGAGLSGINVAYRLQEACPDLSYQIVERREGLGGTWDLFRYPGVRSDSDVYTLSYPFHPFPGRDTIVEGGELLDYLSETARRFGIDSHIRYSTEVAAAQWSSTQQRWTVTVRTPEGERRVRTRFLISCTGYYDYDHPHDPQFAGIEDFAGTVVHPQSWPSDLDYRGKRVVVIGSGATAITIVPAIADEADVTMLQRTPTYVLSRPRRDPTDTVLRRLLPAGPAHRAATVKNIVGNWALYQLARRFPGRVRSILLGLARREVGAHTVEEHFTPPYNPWDQRLCVASDGDLFRAVREGKVRMVTDRIDRIAEEGIVTGSGKLIPADIIVTATGLSLKIFGDIDLTVDGQPVPVNERYAYLGTLLSDVPNFGFCIGYINLSWTVRSDATARLLARVIGRLRDGSAEVVTPRFHGSPQSHPLMDMKSGYLARALDRMPRTTDRYPWAMDKNVLRDLRALTRADLDEGLEWTGSLDRSHDQKTAPGLRMPLGSSADLMRRVRSITSSPT